MDIISNKFGRLGWIAGTVNPTTRTEIDDIINFLASQGGFIEIRQSK